MNETNRESVVPNVSATATERGRVSFSLTGLFGLALFVLFFLPWLSAGLPISGLEMAKSGGNAGIFCLVPLGALWVVVADVNRFNVRLAKVSAGVMPLLLFAYHYSQNGKEIWDALQPAGFLTIAISCILILLPTSPSGDLS